MLAAALSLGGCQAAPPPRQPRPVASEATDLIMVEPGSGEVLAADGGIFGLEVGRSWRWEIRRGEPGGVGSRTFYDETVNGRRDETLPGRDVPWLLIVGQIRTGDEEPIGPQLRRLCAVADDGLYGADARDGTPDRLMPLPLRSGTCWRRFVDGRRSETTCLGRADVRVGERVFRRCVGFQRILHDRDGRPLQREISWFHRGLGKVKVSTTTMDGQPLVEILLVDSIAPEDPRSRRVLNPGRGQARSVEPASAHDGPGRGH